MPETTRRRCAMRDARCAVLLALTTCLLFPPANLRAQALDSIGGKPFTFAVGADLSFLKDREDHGVQFKDHGVVRPALDIFKDHGYNWIRLRVFHAPTRLPNNLQYTIALAKEAKARGYHFLLDYHFSDTWADPQHQITPTAWDTTHLQTLIDSVRNYTRDTFRAFQDSGVTPDMVQIGNEVRNGMMWPLGKLPAHWDNFMALYKAALEGIDDARGNNPRPVLMVHYDNGADAEGALRFFQRFSSYGLPYDIIGFSYYPWWHGNLLQLRENLLSILHNFPDKDVILVEVGYRPYVYERSDSLPPYPEDAPGGPRKMFLEAVTQTVLAISDRRIKGIFWWEPATGCDSDFFDKDCDARPVMDVFDHYRRN
jgi:arabinogalactan endo-1,4-beta-galactosidase